MHPIRSPSILIPNEKLDDDNGYLGDQKILTNASIKSAKGGIVSFKRKPLTSKHSRIMPIFLLCGQGHGV